MKSQQINLNTADVQTLTQLPGIGEQLAQRIVAFRDEVRPFEEIIELAAVPGISERMVRELAPDLTVGTVLETRTPDPALDDVREEDDSVVPDATTAHVIVRAEDTAGEGTSPGEPAPTARATSSSSLWGYLFSALAGALVALLTLYLLNGGLYYSSDAKAERLQGELQRQRDDQSALRQQLEQSLTAQATAASRQATTSVQLEALQESATAKIATVEAAMRILERRVEVAAGAAEDLNAFLDGMQRLLLQLRGTPVPGLTPAPVETPALTVTPVATRPGQQATRTPRPTATPLLPRATTAPDG